MNFDNEVIYTFFDGKEHVLTTTALQNLLSCKHYTSPHEVPKTFSFDNVWKKHTWAGSVQRKASYFKSPPLQFLHHFIATTVQRRSGSFNKVIVKDLWMLDMVAKGQKINLA